MQPWTEALLKRLSSGSVHAGILTQAHRAMVSMMA